MEETNFTSQKVNQWIAQAQAGDLDAFNQLVLAHQDAAFRMAQWMLGDDAAAEDIVQNTFLAAYRGFDKFRSFSFRSWLLKMVRNASIDELRRRTRHPWLALEAEDAEGNEIDAPRWLIDPGSTPEEAYLQREAWEGLERSLACLPSQMREVVMLVDVEGLDYAEAAQILGVPLGTVKSRLGRARASLRKIIGEPERAATPASLFATGFIASDNTPLPAVHKCATRCSSTRIISKSRHSSILFVNS